MYNRYYLTACNGMTFSRSVNNPNSRLNRVRKYLHEVGSATKREILRDVFGFKEEDLNPTTVRGWGSIFFGLGVRHKYFTNTRVGRTTYWSLHPDQK
jgi:hypothetical protein